MMSSMHVHTEMQSQFCKLNMKMLTFILQTAFSVRLNLHFTQVLGTLVLQQSSLSLQLPQRGLDSLSAIHLTRNEFTHNVK